MIEFSFLGALKFVAMGAAAGCVSGMGMGGGTVLIPLLILFGGIAQRDSQCINLLAFLPAGFIALIAHKKASRIDIPKVKPLVIWGILGAAAGTTIAMLIDETLLRKAFGCFAIGIAVWQFYLGEKKQSVEKK